MALNRDFRVKDALYVGTSGYFAGTTSINTAGKILSAGVDLITLFQNSNLATLSNGDGIATFSYDGDSAATVAVNSTVVRTTGAQTLSGVKTFSDTPVFNSGITVTGNIGVTGTVDGRDVSNDGLKLDSTYTTVNVGSGSWNSVYTTTNSNSASWGNAYTVTSSNSAKWDSTYTTVNANSANGSSVYTTVNANSGSWGSNYTTTNSNSARWSTAYTAYNSASANLVNTGSSPSQGTVRLTQQNGSNIDIDTGLQTGDSPTFAGATAGNIRVGITTDNEIDTSTGDLIIDSAGGLTTITDNLSVTGTVTTSGLGTGGNTDSVVVKNADSTLQTRAVDTRVWGTSLLDGSSLTTGYLTKVSDSNTLIDSIVSESGSTVTVAGGFCATTLSGNGAGITGVTATPIFPTTAITTILSTDRVFVNDGANKYITYQNLLTDIATGAAGTGLDVSPSGDEIQLCNVAAFTNNYIQKWNNGTNFCNSTICDNGTLVTVNNAFCTTGNNTLGTGSGNSTTINGTTINVPNIAAGTDNSVVVYNGSSLVTDEIDPKVWAIKLVDYGTLGTNYIPVATNGTGTIGNSIIQQTGGGTGITVSGDTTVTGNLSVTGNFTYIDTTVSVTSALTITNTGTGPALKVTQTGVNPIAQFIDNEGGTIIFANDGNVGIGLALSAVPTEKLTISGNISSNGNIIISGTVDGRDVSNDGLKLDSTYTTVNTNSASWGNAYTVTSANSASWNSVYTTTNSNSANWNTAYTQGTAVYSTVLANSASWGNAYTVTSTNSANWNIAYTQATSVYSTTNANSARWSTAYTAYNTTSGALVNTGSSPSQGTVRLTQQNGSNVDIDTGLQSGDSPTFAGATISANGRIKQYATGGTIYSEEGSFTATVGATPTTVATFTKSGLETAKYIVSLTTGALRTAFEILVTYNGTDAFGTVYAIIDAQAASQLAAVDVSVASTTVDLVITAANAGTTAVIYGVAHY